MTSPQLYIGIDVSKDSLDVHIHPTNQTLHIERAADPALRTLLDLIAQHDKASIKRIVLEATGGLEIPIAATLHDADLPVVIVNPSQVHHFARSIGQLAKTDRIDAFVIARFAQAINPPLRTMPDESQRQLRETMVRRRQIIGMIVEEKNRLGALGKGTARNDVEVHIRFLQGRLERIDEELDKLVRNSPIWCAKDKLLTSVPGVGPTTSHALLAWLPELGTLNRKQIASLAGLAPVCHDSGRMRGKRSIWGGRAELRTVLYMATLTATRCNPVIKRMYQRLKDQGKLPKVAIIACARKLLVILNTMIKENKSWNPRIA